MEKKQLQKSKDFNIYYLNFSKVYEIAMMINNVILTRVEREKSRRFEEQNGYTFSLSPQGTKRFLDGIKASFSYNRGESAISTSKVIESLDVKTTKSILLRSVIQQCDCIENFDTLNEGALVKVDNVRLELLNEESLRQFLILRRDALKGMRIEGMDINNVISSMLQDYAYILKGTIIFNKADTGEEIIIKIPMEIQSEFESKYSINDLLIGHVSLVGIYKGKVREDFITSNTFTYFQDVGNKKIQDQEDEKLIKSNSQSIPREGGSLEKDEYCFIDILAIIQDVEFALNEEKTLHWWNRLGMWLSKLGRN